jgi:hypothetical protein
VQLRSHGVEQLTFVIFRAKAILVKETEKRREKHEYDFVNARKNVLLA